MHLHGRGWNRDFTEAHHPSLLKCTTQCCWPPGPCWPTWPLFGLWTNLACGASNGQVGVGGDTGNTMMSVVLQCLMIAATMIRHHIQSCHEDDAQQNMYSSPLEYIFQILIQQKHSTESKPPGALSTMQHVICIVHQSAWEMCAGCGCCFLVPLLCDN